MKPRFNFQPQLGSRVYYQDEVWTVCSQAPGVGKWWLLPYDPTRTEPPSSKDAVMASSRDMAQWKA